jgi:tetratricopeptide (TPR) repeat protein
VLFALGNVLMGLARFQQTLDRYDQYLELRESQLAEKPWSKPDADFFANYALVLRVMADSADAETEKDSLYHASIAGYERALSLDESRADILDDLGIAYYQMGEYPEAIRVFRRKIEMEPELTNGYLNLAYAFLQQKNYDSVLSALEGMLGVDSCNQQAFEIGGYVAAFEKQNGAVARQWYNRQLACDPTNCDAKMYIGYTYLVTNDTAQIRRCIPVLQESYECRLAKGEAKCGDNIKQNALWLAEAYLALRNLDRAVEWAGKVLACEPGNSRAKAIKEQAESEY